MSRPESLVLTQLTALSVPPVLASEIVARAPATGEEIWRAPTGDVDAAVAQARESWPEWAGLSLAMRIEALRRFVNVARRDTAVLADTLARESGRPLWDSRGEVEAMIARVEAATRAHGERAAQRRHNNGLAGSIAIRHKPHGVIAAISPAAQGLLGPASQIFPALIAGNGIVFKPSEKASASAAGLFAALREAGMGEGAIGLLPGGPAQGRALATHGGIDGVIFAGSAAVGVPLARRLAARPDRMLAMEVGGNNPLVVWDTKLVEEAATIIVQSAFGAAGQRCTAARRLIVKAGMFDAIMPAIKALADRMIIGAPFDEPAPYIGPVVDEDAADGLTQSFIWLMSNGGKPIKHLARPRSGLPFVTPAIIDVTAMRARTDFEQPDVELFGPLLQVIRVDSWEAAMAEANATRFNRVAGLIGGNPQDYQRFWNETRAGVVTWNRPTTSDLSHAPSGGMGLSGNLRPGGAYAADYCSYPVSSAEVEQPRASVGVGFGS